MAHTGRVRTVVTDTDRRIGARLRERIVAVSGERVRRVILYGSRALGSAGPDSDFDLLVVEADPVAKRDEVLRLTHAVCELRVPVDLHVMGELEFEETKGIIGGLAYPAHRYGVECGTQR